MDYFLSITRTRICVGFSDDNSHNESPNCVESQISLPSLQQQVTGAYSKPGHWGSHPHVLRL